MKIAETMAPTAVIGPNIKTAFEFTFLSFIKKKVLTETITKIAQRETKTDSFRLKSVINGSKGTIKTPPPRPKTLEIRPTKRPKITEETITNVICYELAVE